MKPYTLVCRIVSLEFPFTHTNQVEFAEDGPRNPANFTYARKWVITFAASFFSIATGKILDVAHSRELVRPSGLAELRSLDV